MWNADKVARIQFAQRPIDRVDTDKKKRIENGR